MAVSIETNRVQYVISSLTQVLPVPFLFFSKEDLEVISTHPVTYADSLMTLDVDYSVTGEENPSGGTVVLIAGPIGHTVTILRKVGLTSGADLGFAMSFPSGTINEKVDKIWMAIQRMNTELVRSIRIPVSNGDLAALPRTARAFRFVAFDANGNLTLSLGTTAGSSAGTDFSGIWNSITLLDSGLDSVNGTVAGHTSALSTLTQRIEDTEDGVAAATSLAQSIESQVNTPTTGLAAKVSSIETTYATKVYADARKAEAISAAGSYTDSGLASKNRVFAQGTSPSGVIAGDLWINTSDSNKLKVWNGSSWVDAADTRIASLVTNVATITTDYATKVYADGTAEARKAEAISAAATAATSYTNGQISGLSSVYATPTQVATAKSEAISAAATAATSYTNGQISALSSVYATPTQVATAKSEAISSAVSSAYGYTNGQISGLSSVYATPTSAESIANNRISASLGTGGDTKTAIDAAVSVETSARVDDTGAIKARWGVQIDANGRVSGRIKLDGSGGTSTFELATNVIKVSDPSYPTLPFDTNTGAVGSKVSHSFGTGTGFGFSHSNPATLYGPGNSGAASNPSKIAAVRSGYIKVMILARMVGYTGDGCIYWRKNGTGSYLALAAVQFKADVPVVIFRGSGYFSGLTSTDYFEFFVAPCTGSGDISVAPSAMTTEIDAISFNW